MRMTSGLANELLVMACVGIVGISMVTAEPFATMNSAVGATVGVTSNAFRRVTFDGAQAVSIVAPTNCFVYIGVNMSTAQLATAITTTNCVVVPASRSITIRHAKSEPWIESLVFRAQALSTGDVTYAAW